MKVIVAPSAGFCWGVTRAVNRVQRLAAQGEGPIHTDGPLIHSDQMVARLRERGIRETADPEQLREGVLVVRAHGIPPDRRLRLRALPVRLVDATCPDVARIQGRIRMFARRGYDIVIFGDPSHAEVVGLAGFAEGRAHVVTCAADVEALPELRQVCLVSQSTQMPQAYEAIAAAVQARFPRAKVIDTICASTRRRQQDLLDMAGRVDAIVVVGGAHSANTLHLVELARSIGRVVHVEHAGQLRGALDGCRTVGLTAGASTPAFVIEDVRRALERMPEGTRRTEA